MEIRAHGLQVLAAEGVVDAQLQDHDLGAEAQRQVDPAQSTRRRIARDARIDHAVGIALRPEPRRQQSRVCLLRRHALPRRETVAEGDDDALLGAGGRGEERRQHEGGEETTHGVSVV